MRAKEFIFEAPLPQETDKDKARVHTDVWNHDYEEPGWPRKGTLFGKGTQADLAKIKNDNHFLDRDELLSNVGARHMGSGMEATVIKYDANHEVVKILGTDSSLADCAHLQYLLACKKYATSNPYLPRIESIKTNNYYGDRLLYTIAMETLEELAKVSVEDLDAMLTKMYGMADYSASADISTDMVTSSVRNVIEGFTKGVDPLLVQAGKIIKAVAAKVDPEGGFGNLGDLHSGNMMVRRTSTGPQLVITDPLYSGE